MHQLSVTQATSPNVLRKLRYSSEVQEVSYSCYPSSMPIAPELTPKHLISEKAHPQPLPGGKF